MSKSTNNIDHKKATCAVSLSDMEIFVFPELMYSLLLANIMSPRIWKWRDDPWFDGIDDMKPYKRITRLKQYIMDKYIFNLDLDTWGLTDKDKEIERFKEVIDPEVLSKSNALFGYEGDKYYFDIDIRTHFGLDKYDSNKLPYWKTETVEAMDAFRHRKGYENTGAGECVSLAGLYAAALFIVCKIPLEDIYMMATPLHSQNYISVNDGILTNNRRLVTKNMWFNGTALSAQARRALENEQVTIISHQSGYIHSVYEEATIDKRFYDKFHNELHSYLRTDLTPEILCNFIRHKNDIQKCFQLRWEMHGVPHYIPLEVVLSYENGSPYLLSDNTRKKLIPEIDMEEFTHYELDRRIILNELEDFIKANKIDFCNDEDRNELLEKFSCGCLNREYAIRELIKFCDVEPRLPDYKNKKIIDNNSEPLSISCDMSREEIVSHLESIVDKNSTVRLAFYAYRDINRIDEFPFVLAAIQRNPVSIESSRGVSDIEVVKLIKSWEDESIYDEDGRLAQPDEVWNFTRGDGAEKAILLANIMKSRYEEDKFTIDFSSEHATLSHNGNIYAFETKKNLIPRTIEI